MEELVWVKIETTKSNNEVWSLNLKTAVGSQKSTQALDAPSKSSKTLITNKVTTRF